MRTLGNILWFLIGGLEMGLAWWLAGLVMYVSIVGIPFGRSCFEIGTFTFFPFGREAVRRDLVTGESDVGTSPLGTAGNVLWFALADRQDRGAGRGGGGGAAAVGLAVSPRRPKGAGESARVECLNENVAPTGVGTQTPIRSRSGRGGVGSTSMLNRVQHGH